MPGDWSFFSSCFLLSGPGASASDPTYNFDEETLQGWTVTDLGVDPTDHFVAFQTSDLIDTYSGGWGWIGMDDVLITGTGDAIDPPIEITEISFEPETGTVSLTWASSGDELFVISESGDLAPESWSELENSIPAGPGDQTEFSFQVDETQQRRFYRISKAP